MKKRILLSLFVIIIPIVLIGVYYIFTYPVGIFFGVIIIIPILVINTIITPFIYFIEKKSIAISVIILVIIFLNTLEVNESELTNFENWEFYNHQTIILKGLDKIIGNYYFEIVVFLYLLSINFVIGIVNELYYKFIKN